MAIQITIVGLDRVGLSLGMALRNSKTPEIVTGFDLDIPAMKTAEKVGALDNKASNLRSAVEKADMVLLNLTGGEVLEYAGQIMDYLKDEATIINMAPLHASMCEWAVNNLKNGCNLVNATPIIGGAWLESNEPSDQLFQQSMLMITSPKGTSPDAIQSVVDLTGEIGASPLFSDPVEADGLLAMTELFPKVVASLIIRTAITQPSWQDAAKSAGTAFWHSSLPAGQFIAGKFGAIEIMQHKDNLLRYLDLLQDEIAGLREALRTENQSAIENALQRSMDARTDWVSKRISGQWENNQAGTQPNPTSGWKKLLGMEIPARKK